MTGIKIECLKCGKDGRGFSTNEDRARNQAYKNLEHAPDCEYQ